MGNTDTPGGVVGTDAEVMPRRWVVESARVEPPPPSRDATERRRLWVVRRDDTEVTRGDAERCDTDADVVSVTVGGRTCPA